MDNHSIIITTSELPGGVTRASVGGDFINYAPTPWAAHAGQSGIVHQGVVRDDGSGGVVRDSGQHAPTKAGSILATAKSNAGPTSNLRGSDVTVELEPGNPASRTSVKTALALGLLVETAPGIYSDAGGTVADQLQAEQEAQTAADQAVNGAESDVNAAIGPQSDFGRVIEPLQQASLEVGLAGAAAAVADGTQESWDRMAKNLQASEGLSPDQAQAVIAAGYQAYEGTVARAVSAIGIEGAEKEAFYTWLQNERPQDLQEAVQRLTLQGNTSSFRNLAVSYLTAQSRAGLAGWHQAGWDAYVDEQTGHLMVSPGNGRPHVEARRLLKA